MEAKVKADAASASGAGVIEERRPKELQYRGGETKLSGLICAERVAGFASSTGARVKKPKGRPCAM